MKTITLSLILVLFVSACSRKTETNVTFTQVFSPGLYAAFGLFGSPFVAGGGVSYAPELRSLEKTDPATGQTTSEKVSAFRYGAFLAVDVTIFPL